MKKISRQPLWDSMIEPACCNCKLWKPTYPEQEHTFGTCQITFNTTAYVAVCDQHIWINLNPRRKKTR